ncbi:NAD-binding protein [Phellopilus nigrolimitatus]|nr:NAD-binding protein [Phellopilus nigrolimitatus]
MTQWTSSPELILVLTIIITDRKMSQIAIVGGHGNVSMRLARLLVTQGRQVFSIIRNPEHSKEVAETGATPSVLSIEDDSKEKFAETFEGKDIVYFSAGAGGKGGPERTRKVDYEGAVKVFDAIELVKSARPRLIMVSAIDIRDPNTIPAHYNEEDKAISEKMRKAIGTYVQAKYDADKNLAQRTAFKWTILRPVGLTNGPGTGKATVGKAHLNQISRDDVALTLALLADRADAAGLGIDLGGGEAEIEGALDAFIKKGESDFLG